MAKVKEIYDLMDQRAPFSLQMDFDNAGLLVGRREQEVERVLVALDVTEEVVREAVDLDVQLILSHHPVIFHPLRRVTDEDPTGRIVRLLVQADCSVICAHTNLDLAEGGVNDALAQRLGLLELSPLCPGGTDSAGRPYALGRVGRLPEEMELPAFVAYVKERLGANGVRYADGGKKVRTVAVGGGACGEEMWQALSKGCDTFVTADIKYNLFLDARAQGLNLLDAGHYPTENVVCPVLCRWLGENFPGLKIFPSEKHREVLCYG